MLPGLADNLFEAQRPAIQHDRRRVLADFLVQMVQAVLGGLHAVQKIQCLGTILNFQGQHLQAGLHALHGVAVFVGQPCHHFADGRQPFGLPLRRHVAEACHVPHFAAVAHQRAGKTLEDPPVLEVQDVGLLPHGLAELSNAMQKCLGILKLCRRVLQEQRVVAGFQQFGRETPHPHEALVEMFDLAACRDDQDAVGGRLQRGPQSLLALAQGLFGLLQFGDIAGDDLQPRHFAAVSHDRCPALDRHLRAVLRQANQFDGGHRLAAEQRDEEPQVLRDVLQAENAQLPEWLSRPLLLECNPEYRTTLRWWKKPGPANPGLRSHRGQARSGRDSAARSHARLQARCCSRIFSCRASFAACRRSQRSCRSFSIVFSYQESCPLATRLMLKITSPRLHFSFMQPSDDKPSATILRSRTPRATMGYDSPCCARIACSRGFFRS